MSARAGVPVGFDAVRTIVAVQPTSPVIQLAATSSAGVGCYAVEERVAGALTPTEINLGGVWLPTLRVIRWGPFLLTAGTQVLS